MLGELQAQEQGRVVDNERLFHPFAERGGNISAQALVLVPPPADLVDDLGRTFGFYVDSRRRSTRPSFGRRSPEKDLGGSAAYTVMLISFGSLGALEALGRNCSRSSVSWSAQDGIVAARPLRMGHYLRLVFNQPADAAHADPGSDQ